MPNILRNSCVLTNDNSLKEIFCFKKIPIHMGCFDSLNNQTDIYEDMSIVVSTTSKNIQLLNLIDPNVLYSQSHNAGEVGGLWKEHHEKFYKFIDKNKHSNVLEIGGASGSLLKLFLKSDNNIEWHIIEPYAHLPLVDPRVTVVNAFFEKHNFVKQYDTIVHSHVLEHVYDPISFLIKVNNTLTDNGLHYITVPNMKHWLENGYVNTLMFEHTYYIDEKVLSYLLDKTGFEVVEKVIEEHSIFFCCKKNKNIVASLPDLSYVEPLYKKFINNLVADIDQIKEQIKGKQVYLFGAHIFSQILINLGIEEDQIISILDNSVQKQGKRLYGTNLKVESPLVLQGKSNPIVVVRSGAYTSEIKKSLITVNNSIKII